MERFRQPLRDPAFIQDPNPAYHAARTRGPVLFWEDMGMAAAFDAATVGALLRDRRLGRERRGARAITYPPEMSDWALAETHSLLDMEPPRHTRLRGLVLRAFTSRRIKTLAPDIHAVCADLLAANPDGPFDLIPAYCTQVPVRIIARLLGVPEALSDDLLRWSSAMVAMYQAGRDATVEANANRAAAEFIAFLRSYVDKRRSDPRDDLITELIAAEEDGEKLTPDELIGTCILLLNAGHEATVHSLGNGVKTLLENQTPQAALGPDKIEGTVEEILRFDAPLHVFTRFAYETIEIGPHTLTEGDEIALVLGAANRDPAVWPDPDHFDPDRPLRANTSFGAGPHFCVGAPLARLELQIALPALFERFATLTLTETPRYADSYHFHKLDRLMVTA